MIEAATAWRQAAPTRLPSRICPSDTAQPGGATAPCADVCLILPDGMRVAYTRLYPGTPQHDAQFEHTATPSRWYKSHLSWNEAEKRWHLRLRDGTVYLFGSNAPLQAIRDRNGNQLTITRSGQPIDAFGARRGKVVRIVT